MEIFKFLIRCKPRHAAVLFIFLALMMEVVSTLFFERARPVGNLFHVNKLYLFVKVYYFLSLLQFSTLVYLNS
jgi:hypothetical protein